MKQHVTDIEIVELIAEGKTAKEVADKVGMKRRGIEQRIRVLKKKHEAKSATQLVCILKGLLTDPSLPQTI